MVIISLIMRFIEHLMTLPLILTSGSPRRSIFASQVNFAQDLPSLNYLTLMPH